MVFIRVKKIKGKEYAYLVENKYKKRGNPVKQKTKKYLGRVMVGEKRDDVHFLDWLDVENSKRYIEKSNEERIVDDLIRWELYKHNVEGFDIDKKVLKINNGFLCKYTRKELIKTMHKIKNESSSDKEFYEREHGIELAEGFVKAGIKIPKSVFIALFKKLGGGGI